MIQSDVDPSVKAGAKADLSDYKTWLEFQEKSKLTVTKYLQDIQKFIQFVGKDRSRILKKHIVAYKADLIAKYKPVSVNSYLSSLNSYLVFLKQSALRVKIVRIQRKTSLNNVPSETEYNALLAAAKARSKTRLYYLIRVLASSGIRVSELKYITVEMLKEGKTFVYSKNKIREIIIPDRLCAELRQYCAEFGIQNVVFHGRKPDTLIDKARIWRELHEIAAYAGIPAEKAHAHNFRHLFAKTFLANHHDLVDLADILGHSSVETTRIYTRTSSPEKRERINALNL
jgi:site-specific recombinase XerD